MYPNLNAEIARKGLKNVDIAKYCDIAVSTLISKFKGRTSLTWDEALKIKELLEVDIPLETLLARPTD